MPNMQAPASAAREVPVSGNLLLDSLDAGERERLLSFARSERHAEGAVIFRKGDPGDSLMMIVSGRIKISNSSPGGPEVVLSMLGDGEVLGEMAVFEDGTRSADATAIEDSELLVLHRRDVLPFLESNPRICVRLLAVLSARLRRTSAALQDRTFLTIASRLAKTLLDLAVQQGEAEDEGVRVTLGFSQRNLGAMLGASRETVNRQLHAWQDDGLIRLGRGYVMITRPDALAGVGGLR